MSDNANRKRLFNAKVLLIPWFVIFLLFSSCREESLEDKKLQSQALSITPHPEAIRRLVERRGKRAVPALVSIAKSRDAAMENSRVAMQEIAQLNSVEGLDALAELLVPHTAFSVREAVAETLVSATCSERCIASVLSYHYRLSKGDRNLRELSATPDVQSRFDEDQARLVATLNQVLRSNESTTVLVLSEAYGLGTEQPAPFAIATTKQLEFRSACPLLLRSLDSATKLESLDSAKKFGTVGSASQLKEACSALGCS